MKQVFAVQCAVCHVCICAWVKRGPDTSWWSKRTDFFKRVVPKVVGTYVNNWSEETGVGTRPSA